MRRFNDICNLIQIQHRPEYNLSVYVRERDASKSFGQILVRFPGAVGPGQNNNRLSFGAGTQLPWRRFVLSKHLFVQY